MDKTYIVKNGGEVKQELMGSGSGDMTKAVYDPDEDGIIALAQLDPNVTSADELAAAIAAHQTNPDAHHEAFTEGDHGALPNPHHSNALDHDGTAQDTVIAGKTTLAEVKADADIADAITKKHDAAHTLASHSSKAHSELTGVGADDHHPQAHTLASHSSKAHSELTSVGENDHHTKFTQTEHDALPNPHHPQSHMIASHSDTVATGAQLNELVGGGQTALHSHAGGGGESEIVVVKVGDTANATTTLADAVGLSFTALANKTYIIEAWIRYATSVTTVGIKLSANGPASPVFIAGLWSVNAAQGTPDGGTFNAYDVAVAASAAPFTENNLARLDCVFRNGATQGTFIIRFAAETTGTITIKDGSVLRYRQVD